MRALGGALYTAGQVRDLDRRAIDELGIPGWELMSRAGAATFRALQALWPAARSLTVLCGPGNNGGDGYVVARVARALGLEVRVIALADPSKPGSDAGRAYEEYRAAGGHCESFTPEALEADVLVDAIYGTGLARPVSGTAARVIEAANASGRPVVAVDVPSGLHADTGEVLGVAVDAALTVTFIGRKAGLYLAAGPDHAGHVVFDALDVPDATYEGTRPVAHLIDERCVAEALPRRRRTAHKGDHGHVLVIGGGPGMPGAARLAGEAALRAGAGLVTLAVHPDNAAAIAARPECMCLAVRSPDDLSAALARATVVAVGPGLGQGGWAQGVHAAALASGKPLVVDADALNLLAASPQVRDRWILTPHPGEAGRLLGIDAATVQADRLAAARALHERFGGTIVLKGAGSIVLGESGVVQLCDRGNPGMAAGGMGDVLTGLVAGVLAQCRNAELAAAAGVFAHAQAGDLAARRGERGLLASDVLEQVRSCVNPP